MAIKSPETDVVGSLEQLRAIYGDVNSRAAIKELSALDKHCLHFIALSPFVVLSSQDDQKVDVSPRGGEAGFVLADDDGSLLIPDWPGNKRVDTLQNIIKHGYLSLLFMIPNVGETLRVIGQATIHDGLALRSKFEHKNKVPITVIKLHVGTAFLHCAKAFMRSNLWKPETWPERSELPTMGEMIRDHAKTDDAGESQADMIKRYEKVLY